MTHTLEQNSGLAVVCQSSMPSSFSTKQIAYDIDFPAGCQVPHFGTWVLGCSTLSLDFSSSKNEKAGTMETQPLNTPPPSAHRSQRNRSPSQVDVFFGPCATESSPGP